MKAKTYNKTGTMRKNARISWQSHNGSNANQTPANDSHTSYRGVSSVDHTTQGRFGRTVVNKLLARKRRRSRHPLRDLRLQRGFTLEELANLTKLSPSYLSRLESGTRRLNADILQRLAHVLSCHPGDLLSTDPHRGKFNVSVTRPVLEICEHSQIQATPRFNAPDLPLYQLKTLNDQVCVIELESPFEWINRPPELVGVSGAISFQVSHEYDGLRYRPGDQIFAHPTRPLSQNCSVLAVTHDNRAYLGEFVGWSSHHEQNDCMILRIPRGSKLQMASNDDLVHIDNSSMKAVYRIIGLIEAA
ncbi:MAG: helix-turn-helix transcriptional regulator [Caedimonas sp.]|jgi:transcriptional regulator with XRE-family HTH domain|nr:helix-turn-helix transcriptional regulator [Caedimonas sp.]